MYGLCPQISTLKYYAALVLWCLVSLKVRLFLTYMVQFGGWLYKHAEDSPGCNAPGQRSVNGHFWYAWWHGMVLYGIVYGIVWHGIWHGMVYGIVWHGMVWHGMVWHGMV